MISKRDNQPETKIIFVGRFMMTATAIFNANGFPDIARREVEVCANRFALFLYNSTLMTSAIQTELSEFISALKPYEDDLKRTCKSHPDLRTVAYSDGLLYLNALHSFLYSLKSFLDVFARLVCKLINPSATPTTFKSKGVALANWVERSAPNSFPDRLRLKELILVQSAYEFSYL
jgi:hypothetical protein